MPWLSAKIEVGAQHAESLSDALLQLGALAVDIADARAGTENEQPLFGEPGAPPEQIWQTSLVSALFDAGADVPELIAQAAQLAQLPATPPFGIGQVAEQDWVRATQSQFDPIRISARLWIVPTWHQAPCPDAVNLILDPGLAFGTGSHPTTRLCLSWLDRNLRGGETVLDYGCGSGILAIAALKLGAAHALGTDIDPQALLASRQNAAQNQVGAEFFPPDALPQQQADVVLANILANPLQVLAPLLARLVRPGGSIVLSGILEAQEDAVRAAYRNWFDLEAAREEGWVCLHGVKK